jgi:hypothetical protein
MFGKPRLGRLPELTIPMLIALRAIELAGGRPLHAVRFRHPGDGKDYRVSTVVLRHLNRDGLIEVMGVAPAVYRVTRLGGSGGGGRGCDGEAARAAAEGWAAQALG